MGGADKVDWRSMVSAIGTVGGVALLGVGLVLGALDLADRGRVESKASATEITSPEAAGSGREESP